VSLALATLLCGLAGCGIAAGTDRPATGDGGTRPSESASVRGDGNERAKVTAADYEEAVHRMEHCLADAKVELVNGGWDPVDHERMILQFKSPGMTSEKLQETAARCRVEYLNRTEAGYNKDNPSSMAVDLLAAVGKCLESKDIPVTGREKNPQDLLRTVPAKRHDDLRECVHSNAHKLYPELSFVAFP
jgi:hypothetical protein